MSGSKPITNAAGAFGYTDVATKLWSEEAEFVAATTLAAGVVVAFATTVGQVTTATTNSNTVAVIGVAADAITSGRVGGVVVFGAAQSVSVAGAVAQFDILKPSATTAGYLSATATPALGESFAIALAASASNKCDVWVIPSKVTS